MNYGIISEIAEIVNTFAQSPGGATVIYSDDDRRILTGIVIEIVENSHAVILQFHPEELVRVPGIVSDRPFRAAHAAMFKMKVQNICSEIKNTHRAPIVLCRMHEIDESSKTFEFLDLIVHLGTIRLIASKDPFEF